MKRQPNMEEEASPKKMTNEIKYDDDDTKMRPPPLLVVPELTQRSREFLSNVHGFLQSKLVLGRHRGGRVAPQVDGETPFVPRCEKGRGREAVVVVVDAGAEERERRASEELG